jgi:hypothetical protein
VTAPHGGRGTGGQASPGRIPLVAVTVAMELATDLGRLTGTGCDPQGRGPPRGLADSSPEPGEHLKSRETAHSRDNGAAKRPPCSVRTRSDSGRYPLSVLLMYHCEHRFGTTRPAWCDALLMRGMWGCCTGGARGLGRAMPGYRAGSAELKLEPLTVRGRRRRVGRERRRKRRLVGRDGRDFHGCLAEESRPRSARRTSSRQPRRCAAGAEAR